MPNIAINTYCTQQCPYCYIDRLKQSPIKTIPVEDYITLLEWFAATEEENIGITGGEPTLHPDFDLILKETDRYCRSIDTSALLYTNGYNLKEYLPYITENILIILNWVEDLDQQEIISLLNQQGLFQADKAILKCPLYIEKKRYKEFWETVKQFEMKRIETCITMPFNKYTRYGYDKERYFNLMKPIFLQFCKDAIKVGAEISITCPDIPGCYFTKEEQELVDQACDIETIDLGYCTPVLEILPDWTASMCFCSKDDFVDIRAFYSIVQLERYFLLKENLKRIEGNCLGRCSECPEHALFQCQGGCLGFADV